MAISEPTLQTRSSAWTVTSDVVQGFGISIRFKSGNLTNYPSTDVSVSLEYVEGTHAGGEQVNVIKISTDSASGTAAVGSSGILSESTYNAIISEVDAWLLANK